MYFVYVLYSVDHDRHYIGMTDNFDRRLEQHNNGLTKSTKAFIPWRIILIEEYNSREKARNREKYLKSAAGRRWKDYIGGGKTTTFTIKYKYRTDSGLRRNDIMAAWRN